MKYELDFSNIDRAEHDIEVKFAKVVTIPVLCDGREIAVAYVGITKLMVLAHGVKIDGGEDRVLDMAGRMSIVNEDTRTA